MSRRELVFVALFAAALVALTSVPYALGYLLPFPGSRFDGNIAFHHDFNTYFAFMRQAAAGQWLFHNPFTPEPHGNVLFNLEWLVAGKLAAALGRSLEAVFQLQRLAAAGGLSVALYWLCCFLFETVRMRRLVFVFLMLGGGFGWVIYVRALGIDLPRVLFLDIYAGLHPFFWVLLQPHFLLAQALAVTGLCLFLHAERAGRLRHYAAAGLVYALVGAVRPFDLAHLAATTLLYSVATRDRARLRVRLLVLAIPAPFGLYYFWLFWRHPVFRWWEIQNVLAPPSPVALALSLGISFLLLVVAAPGLRHFRELPAPVLLVTCGALAALGLFYSYPLLEFTLQFAPSISIPVGLVATARVEPFLRRRWALLVVAPLLVVHSLTSWMILNSHLEAVREGHSRTDHHLVAAITWFQHHGRPREVVLATPGYGNRLPRYSHAAVFCGNAFTTVNMAEKARLVERFFAPATSDDFRRDLLRQYRVRYVWIGSDERPLRSALLTEVFRNPAATIYEVVLP